MCFLIYAFPGAPVSRRKMENRKAADLGLPRYPASNPGGEVVAFVGAVGVLIEKIGLAEKLVRAVNKRDDGSDVFLRRRRIHDIGHFLSAAEQDNPADFVVPEHVSLGQKAGLCYLFKGQLRRTGCCRSLAYALFQSREPWTHSEAELL
jgi:hypothetical protein